MEESYVDVVIKTIDVGQLWGRGMRAGGVTPPALTATADSFRLMTTFTRNSLFLFYSLFGPA